MNSSLMRSGLSTNVSWLIRTCRFGIGKLSSVARSRIAQDDRDRRKATKSCVGTHPPTASTISWTRGAVGSLANPLSPRGSLRLARTTGRTSHTLPTAASKHLSAADITLKPPVVVERPAWACWCGARVSRPTAHASAKKGFSVAAMDSSKIHSSINRCLRSNLTFTPLQRFAACGWRDVRLPSHAKTLVAWHATDVCDPTHNPTNTAWYAFTMLTSTPSNYAISASVGAWPGGGRATVFATLTVTLMSLSYSRRRCITTVTSRVSSSRAVWASSI